MTQEELISTVRDRIQQQFLTEEGSHDWHHIERVHQTACWLQEREGGNRVVIELAALLHEVSDHKLNGGTLNAGGKAAAAIITELGGTPSLADEVGAIVDSVSFKGANVADVAGTLEAQIVQDADRLDAMGAIGIARAFAYGGSRNRPLYDPKVPPQLHDSFEVYAKSKSHTVNHFHEKLLLLKDRLHTPSAQQLGRKRHEAMVQFLEQFHKEWTLTD